MKAPTCACHLVYKSLIYQNRRLRGRLRRHSALLALLSGAALGLLLSACPRGHYDYVQEHCIVVTKGVRPKYVGNDPNYWILLTCPNVYNARPWAEDLPYAEWAHIQISDQRTVTVRKYVK